MVYPKQSLGQHFLRDRAVLEKIAGAAHLSPADTVLETGPGEGTLTSLLLKRAGKVIAVEKDRRLIPFLERKFAREIAAGKLELVHADILDFDTKRSTLNAKRYKLVANLPFYITGAFLKKFLQEIKPQPNSMVLLLQKEVAERIVARNGRESLLSTSVKTYGAPRYIATVKAGSFSPTPKVDSAIIAIEKISRDFFQEIPEARFFAALKRGFAHPRKLLASNLQVPAEALANCGIATSARAENLSPEDWRRVIRNETLPAEKPKSKKRHGRRYPEEP